MKHSQNVQNLSFKHVKQGEAFVDRSRFKFILAGRRGGKTTLVKEDIIQSIWDCPPRGEIFYIGPTLSQAYELMWDELDERLSECKIKYTPRISKRRFEIQGDRKIYIIGAEKIRRIRGHKVFKAYLDELAFFDVDLSQVWKAVRPALADLKGKALVTTTPNGKGTQAYDFYLETLKKPDWKYFHWKTIDNPWIDPSEVESAKREMDERSFKQEFEATWESFEGLAYYNFDENLHLKPCKEIDKSLPIDLLLDFNVNPTTLLVAQNSDLVRIKKEYSFKNSSTVATVKAFCMDHAHLKSEIKVRIFGDAAGHSRASQTGFSNYHYVKEVLSAEGFTFETCVPGVNPPIVDRVQYANAYLKNYYGVSRIEIDPSCTDLIRDLSSQELDGRHPSSKNNLGHKADAASYYFYWMQMETRRGKQGTIQL